MTPQELVANAMLERNPQANRLGIPQQMGAFANSLGMIPTPEQEALHDPLIGPETYGLGNMARKIAPTLPGALGMMLYRGENVGNKMTRGGRFFSTDKEFARQFTQSGLDSQIRQMDFSDNLIHTPKVLPFAGDVSGMDAAIAEARKLGMKAVRVSEGQGQPDSIFVFGD